MEIKLIYPGKINVHFFFNVEQLLLLVKKS